MHANAMREMVKLAREKHGRMCEAALHSIEGGAVTPAGSVGGFVVPSILAANLKQAGHTVEEKKLKHLTEVTVGGAGGVLARGAAVGAADALMQGVYAAMRDEAAAKAKAAYRPPVALRGMTQGEVNVLLEKLDGLCDAGGDVPHGEILDALKKMGAVGDQKAG
jgi:hypothetical protein